MIRMNREASPVAVSCGRGDQAIGLVLPRAVLVRELAGKGAGPFEEVAIDPQPREPQVAPARLPGPEQLSFAAKLEIDLGQLESVGRVDERLQARCRDVRELEL